MQDRITQLEGKLGAPGQAGSLSDRVSSLERQVETLVSRLDELAADMEHDRQYRYNYDEEMHWVMDYIGVPPLGKQAEYLWNGRDMNMVMRIKEPRQDYPQWPQYRSRFQKRIQERALHDARQVLQHNEWPAPPVGSRARTEARELPLKMPPPRSRSVPLEVLAVEPADPALPPFARPLSPPPVLPAPAPDELVTQFMNSPSSLPRPSSPPSIVEPAPTSPVTRPMSMQAPTLALIPPTPHNSQEMHIEGPNLAPLPSLPLPARDPAASSIEQPESGVSQPEVMAPSEPQVRRSPRLSPAPLPSLGSAEVRRSPRLSPQPLEEEAGPRGVKRVTPESDGGPSKRSRQA